jgi:hypothetical protein
MSVIIGKEAASNGVSNQTSTIIGATAGSAATSAVGAVLVGYGAGAAATTATNATMIGNEAGYNATAATNSVLIGNAAGKDLSRSNTLVIDGNSTYSAAGTTGLIYGEFDNRKLVVNGGLHFLPGASVTPTTNGHVTIEFTNNTTLTFKAKGSDGTVRSATLTLS